MQWPSWPSAVNATASVSTDAFEVTLTIEELTNETERVFTIERSGPDGMNQDEGTVVMT